MQPCRKLKLHGALCGNTPILGNINATGNMYTHSLCLVEHYNGFAKFDSVSFVLSDEQETLHYLTLFLLMSLVPKRADCHINLEECVFLLMLVPKFYYMLAVAFPVFCYDYFCSMLWSSLRAEVLCLINIYSCHSVKDTKMEDTVPLRNVKIFCKILLYIPITFMLISTISYTGS